MKRITSMLAGACALAMSAAALGDNTVVPAANTSSEGATSFNLLPSSTTSMAYQVVIGAPALAGIPVGSQIVGVTWRADTGGAAYPAAAESFSQYDIQLATSVQGPGSLSSTFASNANVDAVTVRSGALNLATGDFPGGAAPNAWGLRIPFTTPFVYEGGDLLMTVRISGHSAATTRQVDAVSGGGDFQAHYAFNSAATASTTTGNAVVSRFDFIPPVDVTRAFAPFANANSAGSTDFYPLLYTNAVTVQIIVAASELTYVPRGSCLTGLSMRLDPSFDPTAWPPGAVNFSNYSIAISRSERSVHNMSTTIATNQGSDLTFVRSGALTIPAGALPNDASPTNEFGWTIPFTTPYIYNGGDIHVVIRHSGSGVALNYSLDAINPGSDEIQTGFELGTQVSPTTFSTASTCPVVRFSVEAKPVTSTGTPGLDDAEYNNAITTVAATYQAVIGAMELTHLRPGSTIEGMTWRLDANGQGSWPSGGMDAWFTAFDVQLARAATSPGGMSSTFANNIGTGLATARSGPLVIPAASFPGGAMNPDTNAFGLYIPFATPFVYEGGDLCLTVRHTDMINSSSVYADATPVVASEGYGIRFQAKHNVGYSAPTGSSANYITVRFSGTPSVCLPRAFGPADGPSSTGGPLANSDRTIQYVFDIAELSEVPEGSVITGLSFRGNPGGGQVPSQDLTFPDYTIQMSTSPNSPSAISNTFADNINPDVTTVRSGPLTFPALQGGTFQGSPTPAPNWFYIPFDRPFVYNGGHLCATIRYLANGVTGVTCDALSSATNATVSARSANASNATTGGTSFFAAVVRFSYSPDRCPADYDGNGFVNADDIDFFVADFEAGLPFADFDGNTFVNADDIDFFAEHFYAGC